MSIKKQTGYFESFDGLKIYYEVRGEGKPLVFAYGIGCLINHWQHQINYFSKNYQTIVFDYRAHHNTAIPEDPEHLTIDAIAQDIKYLLEHLNIDNATLLGHSFGAQIITRAYDMFPDKFNGLVYINGFTRNPIKGMFGTDISEKIFQLIRSGYHSMPDTVSYLWKQSLNNPVAIQASALLGGFNLKLTQLKDVEIYARGISSVDLESFLTLFEQMMDYDGSLVLEKITVPTLIIGGAQDTITSQEFQEDMHRRIKNSVLLIVPYGSHCTMLDMPEYVNLKVEKYLKSL